MQVLLSLKTMACCFGVAIVHLASTTVRADSAGDPVDATGNWMNPGAVNSARDRDPSGLSPYRAPASRAPSGQLYDVPFLPRAMRKSQSGWEYSGFAEAGVLAGDANESKALFRRYRDPGNGLYINSFDLDANKPDEARYVQILGGGVGHSDRFYGMKLGRYNDYRVNLSYSETPATYSSTARPIWDGVGTGNLTLARVPGVAPGGATGDTATDAAALSRLINASGDKKLGLVRRKGSVRLDLNLTDLWKFYSSYSLERRRGARPFGGNEGEGETVEPIDYKTHDLRAGLQYADKMSQFNLALSASWFRNDIDTLTWESPFRHISGALVIPMGRIDLYPSNEAYNAIMEYARSLPGFFRGRFNASVALGTMRQNDSLIPPTVTSGTGASIPGGFNGNFNEWNTSAALSKLNADARIDTGLVDLGLSLVPMDKLTVRATFRHYESHNHTNYSAFNPQTGQLGYIIQDNFTTNVFNGTNNLHYRSIPFEGKRDNYRLTGEYRARRRGVLTAEYELEDVHRAYRERDDTWEHRLRLGYADRGFGSITLRLAYEYAMRRGSEYTSDPYQSFYTASLAAYSDTAANLIDRLHNLADMRKYDLADRKQQLLKLRLNYAPRADINIGATLQSKINDYPADFGRVDEQTQDSLNLELNYLPSPATALSVYYSYQRAKMKQADAADTGSAAVAGCGALPPSCSNVFAAPLSIYPADRYWSATSRDRSDALGLGLRHDFGSSKLEIQYTYLSSRSPLGYTYASANALQSPALAAQAGNSFPDLGYDQQIFDAGLRIPLSKQTALRLYYRYETGKISDWHYSGLDQGTVLGNRVYLDAGPDNYRVSLLGAFLQMTF